jgi:hypothetical protein
MGQGGIGFRERSVWRSRRVGDSPRESGSDSDKGVKGGGFMMAWILIGDIKKDTEQWDEHWKDIDVDGITEESNIAWQWVRSTLLALKTEGDALKQRAEDYSVHISILEKVGAMFTESAVYDSGKLITIIQKAETLDKIESAVISISEDGAEWKHLNVAAMMEVEKKLDAVKDWCQMFNQCIDSEAVKKKLYEILFPDEVDDLFKEAS